MKYVRMLFCVAATAICATGLAQIGAKTQQGKIHGTWHNNDFGYQMSLILNADGTGEFDGDLIRFAAQSGKLAITQEGATTTYGYTLQDNSLTLSGGDLEGPIKFVRAGASSSTTIVNKPSQTTSASANKLLGSWSNYGETIEFKSNGQCTYLGQTYPYTVSGNQIILQSAQGNVAMEFSVSGNQLQLSVNGQSLTYNKGAGTTSSTTQGKSSGGGRLDMSLVGKWCYVNVTSTNSGGTSSSECITINADGSYEYYSERSMSANAPTFSAGTSSQGSDRGTWWIEGNRIHYNSTTQGQGSYQLEKRNHPKNGDPMIVLDGTTYVTYYQKSPW